MFLINSNTYYYQNPNLKIGNLPLTFLPIGNKRLYELQIEKIRKLKDTQIFISLPSNFNIPHWDLIKLKHLDVKIIKVSKDFSLGESLTYCLNQINNLLVINILCGSLYIPNLKITNRDAYSTNLLINDNDYSFINHEENIINGFLSISNPIKLLQYIKVSKGNFAKALKLYNQQIKLNQVSYGKIYSFKNINTYFSSKSLAKTERVFNKVTVNDNIVEKRSSNTEKIQAEVNWFNNLPEKLFKYTPKFINCIKNENSEIIGYNLEYLNLLTLNEVYVFGKTNGVVWENILKNCFNFMNDCYSFKDNNSLLDHKGLFYQKLMDRLETFANTEGLQLNKNIKYKNKNLPSLIEIVKEIFQRVKILKNNSNTIIHGDLCFSNIFYDFKLNTIKVIDPRGLDSQNRITIFGDIRYDIAKLAHSIIGLYDFIIAGRFQLLSSGNNYHIKFNKTNTKSVKLIFNNLLGDYFPSFQNDILPITIGLFLSMLPLHVDNKNRQYAFLANALRLYCKLIKVS